MEKRTGLNGDVAGDWEMTMFDEASAGAGARNAVSPPVIGPLAGSGERQVADAYAAIHPTMFGAFLLGLCMFVGMVEGYDVQAMALAAPLLSKAWQLAPEAVGMLLAASLVGQVFGGFLLAPLGDRIGRRAALLMGLAIAGSATYLGAFMPDYYTMMASRLVAGLGLGFALANTITLSMELVPRSWRTIAVVLVSSGYPLGAAAGAAIAGTLLPVYGVASIFYVGGIATLVAFLLCVMALPESPVIMARRSGDQAGLRTLLRRLGVIVDPNVRLVTIEAATGSSNVRALFTAERRTTTLLLWVLNFTSLSLVYFFIMWLPSLFVHSGFAPQEAIRATSLFSMSGILGGLTLAMLLPRIGPVLTLGGCYLLTLASVATFATITEPGGLFYAVLFCCGFFVIGSQFCLHAVVNLFYPGAIRATGLGFALGAGRIGGVVAPIVGGIVLARIASPEQAFFIALIPVAVSLVALLALRSFRLVGLHAE